MTNIPDGYGFVAGRSRENANAILTAAREAGVDVSLVQTVGDGYIAPEAAVKAYERTLSGATDEPEPAQTPTEPVSVFPDGSWKNAAIRKFAEDYGIDLGDATKKADMLSAIGAATKEE